MPAKDTAPRSSGRRRLRRTPSKLLAAVPGRGSEQRGSRPALPAARLRRKRGQPARARAARGLPASVGKALADLTSGRRLERSRGAQKKRVAGLVTIGVVLLAVGGAVVAMAVFIRRRGGRQLPEQGATEPTPTTTAPIAPTATHQQEGNGPPAGDATQELAMRPQTLDPTAEERAPQIRRHRAAPRRVLDPTDPRYGQSAT